MKNKLLNWVRSFLYVILIIYTLAVVLLLLKGTGTIVLEIPRMRGYLSNVSNLKIQLICTTGTILALFVAWHDYVNDRKYYKLYIWSAALMLCSWIVL